MAGLWPITREGGNPRTFDLLGAYTDAQNEKGGPDPKGGRPDLFLSGAGGGGANNTRLTLPLG